jgi:hypothetical protein
MTQKTPSQTIEAAVAVIDSLLDMLDRINDVSFREAEERMASARERRTQFLISAAALSQQESKRGPRKDTAMMPLDSTTFAYTGYRAREHYRLNYTVSGRGTFPLDMLRYDDAEALSPAEIEGRAMRSVRIHNARGCTPARWASFGWTVGQIVEERRS